MTAEDPRVLKRQVVLDGLIPHHARTGLFPVLSRLATLEQLLVGAGRSKEAAAELVESFARGVHNPCTIPARGLGPLRPFEESGQGPPKKKRRRDPMGVFRESKPRFDDGDLRAVQKEIAQESAGGRCSKPYSRAGAETRLRDSNRPSASISYAFPVFKEKFDGAGWRRKLRVCVDERYKNAFTMAEEKVRLEGLREYLECLAVLQAPAAAATPESWQGLTQTNKGLAEWIRRYQEASPDDRRAMAQAPLPVFSGGPEVAPPVQMGCYMVDIVDAYKQLIFASAEENCVGFWNVEAGCYEYVFYSALTFGALVSVYHFLAFAAALQDVARYYGAAVGGFYFDDGNFFEYGATVESGYGFLTALMAVLRVPVHTTWPKSGFSTRIAKVLGGVFDFRGCRVSLDIPPEKREQIVALLGLAIGEVQLGNYPLKILQRTVGLLVWLFHTVTFRGGYHVIRGLFSAVSPSHGLATTKKKFFVQYLQSIKRLALSAEPFILDVSALFRPPVRLVVDASYQEGGGRIGGYFEDAEGLRLGFSMSIADSAICAKAKIMYLEVLAVLVGLQLFQSRMRGRRVACVSDNISGEFSIVQGHNKKCLHISRLVREIHEILRRGSIGAWFEYRLSELNEADALSRGQWEAAAQALGVQLVPQASVEIPQPTQEELDFGDDSVI